MTEAEKQALLDRLDKMASVGATILSNATYAKKQVQAIVTTDQPTGALVIGG